MSRSLTDEDIEAISNRLTEFSGLSQTEHREHHEALAAYIASQHRKALFWDKVMEQVGGWGIITSLGLIGYAVWHGFLWAINKGN